ncbi:MAG: phosphate ABC transporter ATP-binding protein PstB [Candidatus Limnocylindrales bacterium]
MEEAQMPTATDTTQTPVAAQHAAESDHSLPDAAVVLKLRNVDAFYGSRRVVRDISLDIARNAITAIIGPSGSGKSTLLRCIDRMHEVVPHARATGLIEYRGIDLYDKRIDPAAVRRSIGMVFQQPNPFPTMSIFDNVAAPARFNGLVHGKNAAADLVERSLQRAALWDEVKDKLHQSGSSLSGGQQQRLCIARALALAPDVLLMDEPCSALDPIATLQIEQLMADLRANYTILIVTHNMQQAARVADTTAFFLTGEMIEHAPTDTVFSNPQDRRTEEYVTGKFG